MSSSAWMSASETRSVGVDLVLMVNARSIKASRKKPPASRLIDFASSSRFEVSGICFIIVGGFSLIAVVLNGCLDLSERLGIFDT
jgi:hypothetical protein